MNYNSLTGRQQYLIRKVSANNLKGEDDRDVRQLNTLCAFGLTLYIGSSQWRLTENGQMIINQMDEIDVHPPEISEFKH